RYSEAETLLQEALAMRKQLLGNTHPDVGRCLDNLAMLYSAQGNPEEANPLCIKALAILEHSLRADHPWTVRCRENLEALRNEQGG
ncbi:MAG: tetratricopeptide repeat protein, partial [Leptolyngbya sp. SIO1D8]|nr:tetratricopeptide repeat protein [Leptolyngbya sp. SIO1D8]